MYGLPNLGDTIPNAASANITSTLPRGTRECDKPTMDREDMAHVGPGTYPAHKFRTQETRMAGEKDRFVLLGFMARTEAQVNPRLSPACYDSDGYWQYSVQRKVDQGNRSAAMTYLPDVEEGKFPLSIAEREKRRLCATRPMLRSFCDFYCVISPIFVRKCKKKRGISLCNVMNRDDVGLTPPAGGVLNAGSVHTPRNHQPLSRPWNTAAQSWDYMPQGCGHNTITYGYLGLSRAKPKEATPTPTAL